jgi:hypothetical protein
MEQTAKRHLKEGLVNRLGEEMGEIAYQEIIGNRLSPDILEELKEKGRIYARLWKNGKIEKWETLSDIARSYAIGTREVKKYLLKGMTEILGIDQAKIIYGLIYSPKQSIRANAIRNLGEKYAQNWVLGERVDHPTIKDLAKQHHVKEENVRNYIHEGMHRVLNTELTEQAFQEIFWTKFPIDISRDIEDQGHELIRMWLNDPFKVCSSLTRIASEFGIKIHLTTVANRILKGMMRGVDKATAEKAFQEIFLNDTRRLSGKYNHPILEKGLKEIILKNFDRGDQDIQINLEFPEGKVKYDILIENIPSNNWLKRLVSRDFSKSSTFCDILKLTDKDLSAYESISIDFDTFDEEKRVIKKHSFAT